MAPASAVSAEGAGYGSGVSMAAAAPDPFDGLHILLVDDNADVRSVVRLGLELDDRFSAISEATNGAEAIAVAAADPPDVILLDQQMPVMTGLEALPSLRDAAPDARIVVYSAVADEIDLRDVAEADDCVQKGVDLFELYEVLAEPGRVGSR
jgi:CheY-like chemotaxis protein